MLSHARIYEEYRNLVLTETPYCLCFNGKRGFWPSKCDSEKPGKREMTVPGAKIL